MKCYYHPELDSANGCSVCQRPLCPSCSHNVKGRFFCQDCLVEGANLASLARSPTISTYSPKRAALFGLIPGVGAVYNQQYLKATTHFAVFAALAIVADSGPAIFGLATFAFYVFMIIDAYRSAQSLLRQRLVNPQLDAEEQEEMRLPIWGGVLIVLGTIFFLDNLGLLSLYQVTRIGWPLLFIAAGIYLVLYYFLHPATTPHRRAAQPTKAAVVPPMPPAPDASPPSPKEPPAEAADPQPPSQPEEDKI